MGVPPTVTRRTDPKLQTAEYAEYRSTTGAENCSEAASGFGVRSAHARSAVAEGRKPFATPSLRRVFDSGKKETSRAFRLAHGMCD